MIETSARRHDQAIGLAAELADSRALGDLVLAAGCARTIDDLVGYWEIVDEVAVFRWPTDVARAAGVPDVRRRVSRTTRRER